MFTPQWKTPTSSVPRTNSRYTQSISAKNKDFAIFDAPPMPPPTNSLAASESSGFDDGNLEDWKRFKEAGLLDESAIERKDRQALLDKMSRLEKELFDYQYNMGLLLIEKKDLVSKAENLEQEYSEAQEIVKRERVAHMIAVSEAEKREESFKNALIAERKCVVDLERAMRDIHEDHAKAKATSETTVTDLNAHMDELRKRKLDVEEKACSVDAKLAELDRQNFELDRKLQDLEDRENILYREKLSLTQDRESHESNFRRRKEDVLEWERRLQEGEQRLCESRRILNEREEKLHAIDVSSKVKESKMEKLQMEIDLANGTLKKVEADVKNELTDLNLKEKKVEAMKCELEARQKKVHEQEKKLDARERVELEKLLNEHKVVLNTKMHEFESDIKQKGTALEEELKSRLEALDQKEAEINHLEAKLSKREQAVEKKSERVKEKEKNIEANHKFMKEQEKSLKAEEKRLKMEKEQINAEKESFETLSREIDILRNNVRKQELHIEEELKSLEDAEKERTEYIRLQSNLKQEIDSVRRQTELIEKEAADLKLERVKFEKDWEALDEKRAVVDIELKTLAENKANFEKLRDSEEERLKRERADDEERLRLESESIILLKESFEATMENEKLMLADKDNKEYTLMCEDFEKQKQDLYNEMHKRREEWGKLIEEKERAFEERQLRERRDLKQLKDDAEKRRGEMELERHRLEKEREEMELNKQRLEETGIDIFKDIEVLESLSKKLKKQREQLVSERDNFGALIEKIKCCNNCGDSAKAFLCSDLQLAAEEGPLDFRSLSRDTQNNVKDEDDASRDLNKGKSILHEADRNPPQLSGQMSVLRKCASVIFNLSPQSAAYSQADGNVREQTSASENVNVRAQSSAIDELGLTHEIGKEGILFAESNDKENNVDNSLPVEPNFDEGSQKSDVKNGQRQPGKKRGAGVWRTYSVKAVVEDAEAFLRNEKLEVQPNDSTSGNQEKNLSDDIAPNTNARKRRLSQASKLTESEQDVDNSEGNADSVTTAKRKKRGQGVASALPTPGQKRYYLRHHAVPVTEHKVTRKQQTKKAVQNLDETPVQSLDVDVESDRMLHLVEISNAISIEFSDKDHAAADAERSVENRLVSAEVKTAEDTMPRPSEINEISENVEEDTRSMVNENEDEDDYSEVEEDENEDYHDHPGQASIGKKLWRFLTT
ncbi:nuclear matrix constituent protein 1-like [Amaranthus tricolor]|uniref:nuclear matrix constituent protein 1-like n=1 Tax=Amaranthus tricolor TaxID=29722 RepID=UPI002587F84C|nr:nuclear matrix constituent protein 1-like [Amaranthus tricolor]